MEMLQSVPGASTSTRAARLRGVRVLLVEDDPDTADVIQTMLASAGAAVLCAHSAAAALAELDRRGFDVVITDYALGRGLTGYELLEQIRRQPVDGNVPVIGYSAHAGMVPSEEQSAFTAYAAKPLFIDSMIGLVRGVLQRRQP
jgi:diguanylate cyclase